MLKSIIKCNIKTIFILFIQIVLLSINVIPLYARSNKTEKDRIEVLELLEIIDNTENLDSLVTRSEFAKMIVKASNKKNFVSDDSINGICVDVDVNNIYAPYIKTALSSGNMYTYLGGFFKPYENILYSDVCRGCLSLLGYTNSDFTGNRVNAFNDKFAELTLNKYIEKSYTDYLTKRDIISAIYNTLKENKKGTKTCYGTSVFGKLKVDIDGELLAYDEIDTKIKGPYEIKKATELENISNYATYKIFINGILLSKDELKSDIEDYGFAIYYLDDNNNILYAYTERADICAPLMLKKGYVNKIYYSANNMTMPYRVMISNDFYYLESEEMKYGFSAMGKFKEDDYIYFLCNKYNDVTNSYIGTDQELIIVKDEDGEETVVASVEEEKVIHKNTDAVIYKGSLVTAFRIKG